MKKILVIGATGLVGSRFVEMTKDRFDIVSADEKTLDITNNAAVEKYFNENKFDAAVNLAAYTDVAKAEQERNDENGLAWRLNVDGPKNLSAVCKSKNIFFVQFSTDFVFEGLESSKGPFDEDSELPSRPDDLSWYGYTKNRGEVGDAIVRIAYPFRAKFEGKTDWVRKIIELYDAKNLYPLFTDQTLTPIFVDDLVNPLVKIIDENLAGTFHLVSSDVGTYYEMGDYILEKTRGVKSFPEKASLVEFMKVPGRNKRPIWGGLKTEKTQMKLGMKFKTWREMVDEFVNQF